MGAVDNKKFILFLTSVREAYVNHKPVGSGLCKFRYDIYWNSHFGNDGYVEIDFKEESERFEKILYSHRASLRFMYQYFTNLSGASVPREVDVSSMRPEYRNYYHWHPDDVESRIKFMDDIIDSLSSTYK